MDSIIELLIFLAIFLLPAIVRALKGGKKDAPPPASNTEGPYEEPQYAEPRYAERQYDERPQQRNERNERSASEEPASLSDVLRELREAIEGGPERPPAPPPLPPPPPTPTKPTASGRPVPEARKVPPSRLQREFKNAEAPRPAGGEFQTTGRFEHDAHGFGLSVPLSEEGFEQRPLGLEGGIPSVALPTEVESSALKGAPRAASVAATTRRRGVHPLHTRLADPQAAKDAFVLKEVFGPPKAFEE